MNNLSFYHPFSTGNSNTPLLPVFPVGSMPPYTTNIPSFSPPPPFILPPSSQLMF
ncbi:hypothetical protein [aff. Roholtiella sp. LEGE 12411]|uniref:hypothetical protein n=1 Tax=aff. Roholtiella sp. LEGE 12411 TaxID=1828822 RepID=UPI00187E8893|nr:hypothetical protein [aff. Roholtiella sp. LEGE 12411]MBE9037300.1 hypothetical protein [aff. Roholtiella sp. LEGE 12411]